MPQFSSSFPTSYSAANPLIEAGGADARLREFGRDLRRETQERLAAGLVRAREARDSHNPAVDASTAAWAILALCDAIVDGNATADTARIVNIIAFAEGDEGERIRG